MTNLVKIDELVMGQHGSLSPADECYYMLEYTARRRYSHSEGNDLIHNLKKPMDRRDSPEWRYKGWAIDQIAGELAPALAIVIDFATTTLIPIPPSKTRSHPLYDDRLLQILHRACPDADVRELILCREDRSPAHACSDHRPSVEELLGNYALNTAIDPVIREKVLLFDDVITGGNHYIACKTFIGKHYPGSRVSGVFIARRVLQKDPNPAQKNADPEDFADF